MIGKTLAHYEVLSKLGEGGMGAVYLAKDTKLGREVALKILPDQFAKDQERLARFHREARTLAALNHPNIAAIHGLESDQGINFLAMELAVGDDLSVLIAKGPLPVDEALKIARDIARGMEEAHQNGIIHRDLKPANVKVSVEGKVKVLDFGLARAFAGESTAEEESLNSPTITAAMTGAGVILGTAAYMSPEQARGMGVDRRSDIWSFGAVLFEMLTGKRLFQGETISDTLAGILKTDPDWDLLPDDTPDTVRLLLIRCLDRDRTQRLQDIGEARILLSGDGMSSLYSGFSRAVEGDIAPSKRSRGPLAGFALAALVVGLLLGGFVVRNLTPEPEPVPLRRLEVVLPEVGTAAASEPAISPDGSMAVYVLDDRLWLRRFDTGVTLELSGTEGGGYPFWSPDSRQIGFFAGPTAQRIAVDGGAPLMVCDLPDNRRSAGGTWDDQDRFLFTLGDSTGIMAVPARGGRPVSIILPDTTAAAEQDIHSPFALDGDRGILFSVHLDGGSFTKLYHQLAGRRQLLFDGGDRTVQNPAWCESGHVLFQVGPPNGGIWAVPYEPSSQEVLGDPFLVVGNGRSPTVAKDRTLLCATGRAHQDWQLVKVDRTGKVVSTFGQSQEYYPFFSLGPEGRRMVFAVGNETESQLWMIDLERNTQSRLTFDDLRYSSTVWFADGEHMLVTAGIGGSPGTFKINKISIEGSEPPQILVGGIMAGLSPDEKNVMVSHFTPENAIDISVLDLDAAEPAADGEAPLQPFITDAEWQYGAQFSPHGDLVAYVSRETGRDEVYLRRFPQGDRKRQVSADGGGWPQWGASGDLLFYMSGLDLVEVDVTEEPSVRVGAPRVLFTRPRGEDLFGVGWPLGFQVDKDGEHFYMLHLVGGEQGNRPLVYVQNWVAGFSED